MWKAIFFILAAAISFLSYGQSNPPIIECFNAIRYDSSLNLIANKVGLGSHSDRMFSLMANEDYPTENEKAVILEWGNKRERCLRDYPADRHPGALTYIGAQKNLQFLILELYKGGMSYGQFIRQREALNNSHQANQNEIVSQIQQQQIQQQQQARQFCENRYQQCMYRARDGFQRSECQMANAGCGIGNMIGESLGR